MHGNKLYTLQPNLSEQLVELRVMSLTLPDEIERLKAAKRRDKEQVGLATTGNARPLFLKSGCVAGTRAAGWSAQLLLLSVGVLLSVAAGVACSWFARSRILLPVVC